MPGRLLEVGGFALEVAPTVTDTTHKDQQRHDSYERRRDESEAKRREVTLTFLLDDKLSSKALAQLEAKFSQWRDEIPTICGLSSTGSNGGVFGSSLQIKPSSPFPFLKLPPELRLKIYEYALIDSSKCVLIVNSREHSRSVVRVATAAADRTAPPKAEINSQCFGTNLLLACRQTYEEARPILYGKNEFEFGSTSALHFFLKMIRTSRQWLNSIHINNYEEQYAKRAYKRLAESDKLARLSWNFDMYIPNIDDFARVAQPVLKRLVENSKDVEDAVSTIATDYPIWFNQAKQSALDCKVEAFRTKLISHLRPVAKV